MQKSRLVWCGAENSDRFCKKRGRVWRESTTEAIAPPSDRIENRRSAPYRARQQESGVRWVPLEDSIRLSTQPWIRNRIYRKLIDKLALVSA